MSDRSEVRAEIAPPLPAAGRKRRLSRSLVRLAGLAIFAFLLTRIEVPAVLRAVLDADWTLIGVAVLLTAPFFITKAWRWQAVLDRVGIHITLARSILYYGAGLFLGLMTPGQVGELARAYYVRRQGDVVAAAATVIFERALDLAFILIFAVPGFLIYRWGQGALEGRPGLIGAAVAVLVAVAAIAWWSEGRIRWLDRLLDRLRSSLGRLHGLLRAATRPRFALFLAATSAVAFGLYLARLYLLLSALGASMPPAYFVLSMAFVSAVTLLPISIAGVGTRDLAMVAVFTRVGLTAEQAIAMSVLILFLYILNVIWAFGAWLLAAARQEREVATG